MIRASAIDAACMPRYADVAAADAAASYELLPSFSPAMRAEAASAECQSAAEAPARSVTLHAAAARIRAYDYRRRYYDAPS